jgi:hypothetical protein
MKNTDTTIARYQQLISELADALEEILPEPPLDCSDDLLYAALLKRARKEIAPRFFPGLWAFKWAREESQ